MQFGEWAATTIGLTPLNTPAQIHSFANQLENLPRRNDVGNPTNHAAVINKMNQTVASLQTEFGMSSSTEYVLDIYTDGVHNLDDEWVEEFPDSGAYPRNLGTEIQIAEAQDITVNVLAIPDQSIFLPEGTSEFVINNVEERNREQYDKLVQTLWVQSRSQDGFVERVSDGREVSFEATVYALLNKLIKEIPVVENVTEENKPSVNPG